MVEVIEPCSCIRELHRRCEILSTKIPVGEWLFKDPEMGRVAYTISILLMFSLVIIMLMVRSIRRTNSAVEMDALLDAMRFREELDLQERQRRRLLRAKNKVTAWLTRTDKNGQTSQQPWPSSPQLRQPRKKSRPGDLLSTGWSKARSGMSRSNVDLTSVDRSNAGLTSVDYSYSSTVSEIPEIVVTDDAPIRRSNTPCLSLIYDFNDRKDSATGSMVRSLAGSQRPSVCSVMSDSAHRKGSYSLDHDTGSRDGLMDSHQSLSFG